MAVERRKAVATTYSPKVPCSSCVGSDSSSKIIEKVQYERLNNRVFFDESAAFFSTRFLREAGGRRYLHGDVSVQGTDCPKDQRRRVWLWALPAAADGIFGEV
jgi:hypothetical protein